MYVDGDVRVIDHCCINEKYKRSAHRDFNINLKLGVKLPVIFYNLIVYDSHHIMQGIGKIVFLINLIPNGLEKCASFMLGKPLTIIDSMQIMNYFLGSLCKNISEDDFKYLSQKKF